MPMRMEPFNNITKKANGNVLMALFIEEKEQNGDALMTTETGSNILIKYIKKGLSHKINKNNIYVSKIIFKLWDILF
mgnify:CR=1 FL=1